MRFAEVATVSERVAATSKRGEKAAVIADLLRRLDSDDEVAVVVGLLVGQPRQGRLGVGWATLAKVEASPAAAPTLELCEIDAWLDRLAATTGAGSAAARQALLRDVLTRATEVEHRLLWGLFSGELRQGAVDGVMLEAIARGAGVAPGAVRRAHMLSGDLGATASAAFAGGADALDGFTMQPGRAVEPMLASPAADVAEALAATRSAHPGSLVEWKLDGARVQAHRRGGEVRLFTRNLNDVTDRLAGVVDLVAALPGGDLVLDGEVAGTIDTAGDAAGDTTGDAGGDGAAAGGGAGRPRRFQDTMGDFGADAASGRGHDLTAFFFDVMHADGASLIDAPLAHRRDVLEELVAERSRLPGIVTGDAAEATAFMDDAVERGLEGVMVKSLDSPYAAGRRGGTWRKVKPVHTFDLVVLAAEWGHGRRKGWLSNLHLGARGDDGYVMVGKTFKGLTDELLAWQTKALSDLAVAEVSSLTAGYVVHVHPELVVEVAIDGVQRSTRYPGGVALRFARVRRYRPDKRAADADRIEALQAMR